MYISAAPFVYTLFTRIYKYIKMRNISQQKTAEISRFQWFFRFIFLCFAVKVGIGVFEQAALLCYNISTAANVKF
ncbi:hypothetical protein FACS1894187_02440 [Synergistales bacterium]|nr:hypothetical protein FACS1894187_02440 [Synergistales bacterium]